MPNSAKTRRALSLSAVLAISLATLCVARVEAHPLREDAATQIKFKFASSTTAKYVLIVGTSAVQRVRINKGQSQTVALKSTLKLNGSFKVSMHLIKRDGTYGGPVDFKTTAKTGTKNKWSITIKPAAQKTMNLGTLTERSPGFATASTVLVAGQYGRFTSVKDATTGQPMGAGMLGMKHRANTSSTALIATEATCTADGDQDLGGDCDSDGVVNVIDADDDNDGTVDVADASTASFPAEGFLTHSRIEQGVSGYESMKTLNAHLVSVGLSDVEAALGGYSPKIDTGFYLVIPGATSALYDAAWIECGDLVYCNASNGTARAAAVIQNIGNVFAKLLCSVPLVFSNCPAPISWKDMTGAIIGQSGDVNNTTDNYLVEPGETAIHNGLVRFDDHGGAVWGINFMPAISSDGAGILDEFRVGDPYVLYLRNASTGDITTMPLSLGMYFITVPAIKSANGVEIDYTQDSPIGSGEPNPISVGDDGLLTLQIWRPQRQAVAGFDYEDDGSGGLHLVDFGGLRYEIQLGTGYHNVIQNADGSNPYRYTCQADLASGIYTGASETLTPVTDDGGNTLLTDVGPDEPVENNSHIGFTFDIKKCIDAIQAHYSITLDMSVNGMQTMQIVAYGAAIPGGSSRAVQDFTVQLPTAASGW